MHKITVEEFISFSRQYPVLDVRSPAEHAQAHIPGAYNLPLFSDEERKVVGTAYKQQSREQAIKIGLDYFGVKMSKMVSEVEEILKNHKLTKDNSASITVLVHCWRGGMRSAGVAWLLDLYGFRVLTLNGGYKSFRNWVLRQFEVPYPFNIVGGYTGSGKTPVIKELMATKSAIDLEGIARHKGSAFGALGEAPQPSQEMFENMLACELHKAHSTLPVFEKIWLEDESRRIGNLNLPAALWATMRRSPVYFLDIPFEERLNHITEVYGSFEAKELINSITRIQKRLGGLNTKNAINYILAGDYKESFRILLRYYDKYYDKDINLRGKLYVLPKTENKLAQSASWLLWRANLLRTKPSDLFGPICRMKKIPCETVDAKMNSSKLSKTTI